MSKEDKKCVAAQFFVLGFIENNGISMSIWKVACYLGGKVMQVETRRAIRTIELICGQLIMQVFFINCRGMFSSSHHIFQSPLLSSFISSLIISRVVVESTIKSRSFLSCNKKSRLFSMIIAVNRYTCAKNTRVLQEGLQGPRSTYFLSEVESFF